MKALCVFIFSLAVFFVSFGQDLPPRWLHSTDREKNYLVDKFFSGFAEGNLRQKETVEQAKKRLSTESKGLLAENIRVTVKSATKSQDRSTRINDSEQFEASFNSIVNTEANAEIAGVRTETYYDKNNDAVYAFSYVNKTDLHDYYKKQINLDLNKVETAVDVSKQLVTAGKKMSAFHKCEEVKTLFNGIAVYQDLLVAVNAQVDDEALQTTRSKELIQTIEQRLIDLEQSTFVYVDCQYEFKGDQNDAFSSDPGIICDIVKQALSENDCSVVDDDVEADYTLTLIASTTQRSDKKGQVGIISYYANVKGTLYNRMTKKKTVDFAILNAPDAYAAGKSYEDAATKAFKLPALKEKVLEKVLPKIKN
jgi:hypothetical protein